MNTGLAQLLGIGSSGIAAATEAMQTVSNNTANVNTPGYNVQSVDQSELPTSPDGVGQGTQVTSIQRAFDQFIFQQVARANSSNQAAQVAQTTTQGLTAIFPVSSGGAGGLGAALTTFFSTVNQVSTDPANIPEREALLGSAQSLAATFNSVGGQLNANLTSVTGQEGAAVQQINQLATQIAAANASIMAQAGASGGPSNALLDTRDNLVQQLATQIGVSVFAGPNGSVSVYTTGGAALVDGADAAQLAVGPSAYGDGGVAITYVANGQDLTNALGGGTLGGLLGSQSQIVAAQDSVGALAVALASAVNTQQSLGLNLSGAQGGPLFTVAGPQVYAAPGNTGSGALAATIADPNSLVPGDFLLENTASGFSATNLATGQVTDLGSGPTLSLDGMTITVSGTPAIGDTFKLAPTAIAAQSLAVATTDPTAIAAAAPYVATPGSNLGNVQASAGGAAAAASLPAGAAVVPAANFGQALTIQFTSGTAFNVLASGNTVVASGTYSPAGGAQIAVAYPSPPAPSGMTTTVALSPGTAAAGDTFALTPGGVGSNGNSVALGNLAGINLLSGQTLSDAYAALVTNVGATGQNATLAAQAAQAVLTHAQSVQQSVSGVNLDEQAADLVSFQQAYQAAATVIASAQTMFQALLTAVQA